MREISDALVAQVSRALDPAPQSAFTTPVVYPWAVQNFEARPRAARPRPMATPVRLYLHIPFCNYHCTFCFYAVRTGAQRAEMERYTVAIERELEWLEPGTPLSRLVVGGGTPTALAPELLDRIL